MKVIVAGNRHYTDLGLVTEALAASGFVVTEVLCTCSHGPARVAGHQWARLHGVPADHWPVNWRLDGSGAARRRYRQLIDLFWPAVGVVAVWDGRSAATAALLRLARRAGLPVYEHRVGPGADP
jgi:hypothetical protein